MIGICRHLGSGPKGRWIDKVKQPEIEKEKMGMGLAKSNNQSLLVLLEG